MKAIRVPTSSAVLLIVAMAFASAVQSQSPVGVMAAQESTDGAFPWVETSAVLTVSGNGETYRIAYREGDSPSLYDFNGLADGNFTFSYTTSTRSSSASSSGGSSGHFKVVNGSITQIMKF